MGTPGDTIDQVALFGLTGEPVGMLTCDVDVETHSLYQVGQDQNEWESFESMLDSGAARSVCPVGMCKEVPIKPCKNNPAYFRTARGDRVQNHGVRHICGLADDGTELSLMYNVAEVSTALDSVSQICDKGNIVVFTQQGGYICGPKCKLEFVRRNDTYVRTTWVKRPSRDAAGDRSGSTMDVGALLGFPRQV